MVNLLWVIIALAICGVLLRWRSPLLLITPNLLLAAIMAPLSEGDVVTLNLIMLSWAVIIMTVAVYLRGRQIRLDGFEEISANHARMTPRRFLWLAIALTTLAAVFAVWLAQAGVNEFYSAKRARDGGPWFNLVNALLNFFVLHATIVLSLFRLRLSNPHVVMALASIFVIGVVGYLASSRGAFVIPMMTVFFMRLARLNCFSSQIKLIAAFTGPVAVMAVLMALIAAERRGDEGIGAGFEILAQQVANTETGYGLSPAKDAIVWDYSESRQIPGVGVVLMGGFYGLVPRAIWPGKPEFVASGPIAGAFVFRGQEFVTHGAGIPISLPSEIALAFGSAWFLPGMVAAAVLMIAASELLRPFRLMIFVLVAFYSGLMAHGLPKSQVTLLLDAVSLLMICRVAGFRTKRTGRFWLNPNDLRGSHQEGALS